MVWPNFLVIGASKSGTTFLYHCLAQHPQVFMSPIKETNYFAYTGDEREHYLWGTEVNANRFLITSEHDYLALFGRVTTEHAIGEASPLYLVSVTAPMAIRRQLRSADPARRRVEREVIGPPLEHLTSRAGDRERALRETILLAANVGGDERMRAAGEPLHDRPEAPVAHPDVLFELRAGNERPPGRSRTFREHFEDLTLAAPEAGCRGGKFLQQPPHRGR